MKRCLICKEEKSKEEFRSQGKYLSSYCRPCNNEKQRQYRAENREKSNNYSKLYKHTDKCRDKMLKKTYGISLEDYNNLLKSQNNCCTICKSRDNIRLSVDHCHKTGKVRGLLCGRCNRVIGLMGENKKWLQNAVLYLEQS